MGFGGAMAWTVDLDDFTNLCCREPFPLLRTINRELGSLPEQEPTTVDCTKPPAPITPVPPTLTTGIDTGKLCISVLLEKMTVVYNWRLQVTNHEVEMSAQTKDIQK